VDGDFEKVFAGGTKTANDVALSKDAVGEVDCDFVTDVDTTGGEEFADRVKHEKEMPGLT
jgi:hypothetical protein